MSVNGFYELNDHLEDFPALESAPSQTIVQPESKNSCVRVAATKMKALDSSVNPAELIGKIVKVPAIWLGTSWARQNGLLKAHFMVNVTEMFTEEKGKQYCRIQPINDSQFLKQSEKFKMLPKTVLHYAFEEDVAAIQNTEDVASANEFCPTDSVSDPEELKCSIVKDPIRDVACLLPSSEKLLKARLEDAEFFFWWKWFNERRTSNTPQAHLLFITYIGYR